MTDNINKPEHYTYGKFECVDVIHELTQDLAGIQAFCLGNTIKYLWRFQHKNGVEDLKKAKWYLDRLIKEFDTDVVVDVRLFDTNLKEQYVYNPNHEYLGDATNPNKCIDTSKPNPSYVNMRNPRPVYQLDSGMNIINSYPSIHAATKAIKNKGVGYAVRHGTRCNGYYWRYADE